jgi:hypothetical protein
MSIQERQYEELAGEPDHLQTMAQQYLAIADAIQRSVRTLHTIHDSDENKSKSTDALKDSAQDVADDIGKAESRYRVTAQALLDYVPHLRAAKTGAHAAVAQIQHYQHEVSTTSTALDKADDAVKTAADTAKDDATTAQAKAKTAAADAKSSLAYWQGQWQHYADARDAAARVASGKIVDVVEHHNNGLKNPSHHWYDKITNFASSVWHGIEKGAKWLADHFEDICKWAGVLSIFLGWVPILGDVLIGLAILGALLKLGKDIASGASFLTILGDAVGVVLTAFGGGLTKYVGKLAKFRQAAAVSKLRKGAEGFLQSKKFTAAFGITKSHLGTLTKLPDNMIAPGMKNMLKDVRYPFKFTATEGKGIMGSIADNWATKGAKWTEFKQTGGFAIPKLQLSKDWEGLSTSAKATLIAADGRRMLGHVEKLYNTGSDLKAHDWGLNGDRSTQVTLKPEGVLFNLPHNVVTQPK